MMARQVRMRCLLDVLTPLSLVTKRGSSFEEISHTHRGRVSIGDKGSVYIEGCSEDSCIFSFLSILDTLSFVHGSCDHF